MKRSLHKGIHDVLVVTSLVKRESLVGLHADKGNIGRGSEHRSKSSSGETSDGLLVEREGSVGSLKTVGDSAEDSETSCGVCGLAEKSSGKTSVEGHETVLSDDLAGEGNRVGTASLGTFPHKLDANLMEVK